MEVILTTQQLFWGGGYWLTVAVIIWIEHKVVGNLWRKHELARRIMGIVTVMGLSIPLLLRGLLDWGTWLLLLGGFAVAGVITGFAYIWEAAKGDEQKKRDLRKRATRTFEEKD